MCLLIIVKQYFIGKGVVYDLVIHGNYRFVIEGVHR